MKTTRTGLVMFAAVISLLLSVCVAAAPRSPVAASAAAPILAAQLTAPPTIRVKHDERNESWSDWPVGEVRVFDFEDYVKHVVPYESPRSWDAEALKAQAVAARTYAWRRILTQVGQTWDVSDYADTQYMGPDTFPTTNAAVDATLGQYLAYEGQIILAQFSADNGDPTLDNGTVPYLRGVEDPVSFNWERNGHGHGLSQWGAQRWATQYDWNYQQILMHYYTGVSIELPQGPVTDTVAPMGSIVFPWAGWYVTGNRPLVSANASDASSGVSRVDFSARLAGGVTVTIGSDTSASGGWSAAWDVSALADQPITTPMTLNLTVRDVAGNVAAGAPALIGIDRMPPTVTAALDAAYTSGPTVTLRVAGGDAGSGLKGMMISNDWVWEGESLPYFTGGVVSDSDALNGSAWRARAGIDQPGKNTYGPWTTALPQAQCETRQCQYRAYFRLKTTGVLTTSVIARLDVITSTGGIPTILGLHEVRGGDFRAAGEYQEMAVEFAYPSGGEKLEFRTFFMGAADLYLDRVLIVSYPAPLATHSEWTIGDGPLPKTVRVKAVDVAGNVSPDAVVIVGGPPPPPTSTATSTATATRTATPGGPSQTATATPTVTVTPGASGTKTASATPSVTATATATRSGVRVVLPVILADFAALPTPTRTPAPTTVCDPGLVGTFAVGQQPHGVAVAPGRVYVANFTELGQRGTVSVLDSATGYALTSPIAVGLAPNGAAYNPANGMVYVANRDSNDVSVIDTATNRVVATVAAGSMPNGVAVDPSANRIFVANWGSNDITVINGVNNTVMGGRVPVGSQPAMIAANPQTGRVYVANHGANSVTVMRSSDNTVVQTISLPGVLAPYGIAVDDVMNRIYVTGIVSGRLGIIDGESGVLLGTSAPAGGMQPWQVAANRSSGHVLVASSGGWTGSVFTYDGESGEWLAGAQVVGAQPEQGIAADPDSGRVYVTNAGSDSVTVIQDCPS